MDERYLGDGVYVYTDDIYVVLITSNGIFTSNTIFLEPEVLNAFLRYITQLKEEKE